MNAASTTPLDSDFAKQMVDLLFNGIDEGLKQGAHMLWNILIFFLKEHWLAVLIIFFLIFVTVTVKAMTGRWGSLGSFLYNILYFGILFIIGLVWGPEVFVSDYFNAAMTVILYPTCYFLVGIILDKTRARSF